MLYNHNMLHFDYILLEKFLTENSEFISGSSVKKVQQPSRQELIFILRNKGENKKFYININPQFFHICFIKGKHE